MRKRFFGDDGDILWNISLLEKEFKDCYEHLFLDIRNESSIENLFKRDKFDLIVHCAAQPSHDWAAKEPLTDFDVNARATLILLENFRKYSPDAVFIFTSTNKVYGDTPNSLPLVEKATRFEIAENHKFFKGIDESMSLDNSKHSIFGASKVSADVMVQEYGKYFGLKTGVFRGGCLTGPNHSGAELHGFLSYLVKCIVTGKEYKIFGYKGKQVRDNIHSNDLINALDQFYMAPRPGEVYNMGGGRFANVSIIEAIKKIEDLTGRKAKTTYVDQNRSGDHIWYISDLSKFKSHYPGWKQEYNIDRTLEDMCREAMRREGQFSNNPKNK